MNSGKLKIINKDDFESFFEVMKESFPEIERRTYDGQKKLFDNERYRVLWYKDVYGKVDAFIAYWEFDKFIFIEHFSVDEKLRGKGLGSKMIEEVLDQFNKTVVLEVEYPEDEISIRRIEFYKRMKMNMNDYEYVQPPLQDGEELLPLKIMSYPNTLNEREFNKIREELYDKVYKFKG